VGGYVSYFLGGLWGKGVNRGRVMRKENVAIARRLPERIVRCNEKLAGHR